MCVADEDSWADIIQIGLFFIQNLQKSYKSAAKSYKSFPIMSDTVDLYDVCSYLYDDGSISYEMYDGL